MTSRSVLGGNKQLTGSHACIERGTPMQSGLTEFLLDLAYAAGAVLVAFIGAVCLIVPPIYYLFF